MALNDKFSTELAPPRVPNAIDSYVGARMKARRIQLGISQEQLSTRLGLTFQQIQKYEKGVNRIGASRLFEISRLLNVTVKYFYDEIPFDMSDGPRLFSNRRAEEYEELRHISRHLTDDHLIKLEILALVRAYYSIAARTTRKHVFDLIRSLGEPENAVKVRETE